MSIELVMLYNHLICCHPLLLLPSVFPSIKVFSNESALRIRWPKYWCFSFSINLSNEYSGLISFTWDRVPSLSLLQHHSINSLALSLLYGPTLTSIYDYWKNHSYDYMYLCRQSDVCLIFNMLSRLVIAFLPRSKCLLFSWLQ